MAPTASHIPDQYKPEATGEALRNPNTRESEFKENHSFRNNSFVSAYGDRSQPSTG
jgi:hypothetical protein